MFELHVSVHHMTFIFLLFGHWDTLVHAARNEYSGMFSFSDFMSQASE